MKINVLRVLILCCSLLMLTGCSTIDSNIEVGNDFKGKWEAVVDVGAVKNKDDLLSSYYKILSKSTTSTDIMPRSEEEIEEFQSYADKFIKVEPLDENGKVIVDKDGTATSNRWKVTAAFQNEEDLLKTYRIIYGPYNEKSANNVIFPYGDSTEQYMFYMGPSYGTTSITVDGEIDNTISGTGMIKDHTITFTKGEEIRFVFTKGSHIFRNITIGIIVMVIIIGAAVIYKRRGKSI